MTALTDFLLARIAEDEASARAPLTNASQQDPVPSDCWDPARVLAECEAKRRILVLHRPANLDENMQPEQFASPSDARYCRGCNADFMEEWAELLEECPTLRALAAVYADHPDYREEWKP